MNQVGTPVLVLVRALSRLLPQPEELVLIVSVQLVKNITLDLTHVQYQLMIQPLIV